MDDPERISQAVRRRAPHPLAVDACLRLRARPEFSVDKVTSIRLQTYPEAVQYCGNRAPRTAIQAQFSLSYAIAAALVLGDLGPDAYADIDDVTITRLERSVVIEADPARSTRSATVRSTSAERPHGKRESVVGDPTNPMTKDQAVSKFVATSNRHWAASAHQTPRRFLHRRQPDRACATMLALAGARCQCSCLRSLGEHR